MFRQVYSASHNRATPYLMGMGTALILHKLHVRMQHRFSTASPWTRTHTAPEATAC